MKNLDMVLRYTVYRDDNPAPLAGFAFPDDASYFAVDFSKNYGCKMYVKLDDTIVARFQDGYTND